MTGKYMQKKVNSSVAHELRRKELFPVTQTISHKC